jgi:hypothetical protein
MESSGSGVVSFNVTLIPASFVGKGTTLALTGDDARTVCNPVTNNVVIWPGAARMMEGSVNPVPASVGPVCPKAYGNARNRSEVVTSVDFGIVEMKGQMEGIGSLQCVPGINLDFNAVQSP